MDGDQAGIEATIRHAKALQKEGLLVKILNVRDKDPDDVFMEMLKDKRDACEWIEENAVLASQFEIQKIMMTHMSRMNELIMNTIKAVKPIAMSIPEGDERDVFLSQIAHQLHIPLETLIGSEKNERAKV
jgi:DNA primase